MTDGLIAAMIPRLFAPLTRELRPERVEPVLAVMRSTSPRTIAASLRGMAARPDRTAVLAKAAFPVLLVAGKHDVAVHFEDAVRQAALPPVGAALFLEGSGHLAYLEQPEPTRRAMLALAAAVFGR